MSRTQCRLSAGESTVNAVFSVWEFSGQIQVTKSASLYCLHRSPGSFWGWSVEMSCLNTFLNLYFPDKKKKKYCRTLWGPFMKTGREQSNMWAAYHSLVMYSRKWNHPLLCFSYRPVWSFFGLSFQAGIWDGAEGMCLRVKSEGRILNPVDWSQSKRRRCVRSSICCLRPQRQSLLKSVSEKRRDIDMKLQKANTRQF